MHLLFSLLARNVETDERGVCSAHGIIEAVRLHAEPAAEGWPVDVDFGADLLARFEADTEAESNSLANVLLEIEGPGFTSEPYSFPIAFGGSPLYDLVVGMDQLPYSGPGRYVVRITYPHAGSTACATSPFTVVGS